MGKVAVHECTIDDLAGLEERMPLPGGGHRRRLDDQADGRCTYLIASLAGPVGVCVVRWEGPFVTEVAHRLPSCIEVNHLHVVPDARNQGVGRALIGAAERRCVERDIDLIGLGVADDNPDAVRLYERLGFADSGIHYTSEYEYVDEFGQTHRAREQDRFLVKSLRLKER